MSAEAEDRREEVVRPEATSPFYIPAVGTPAYKQRTLKAGDTFVVLDPFGDAPATQAATEGLFHNDTRYLSQAILLIEERRPLLLSSRVTQDNTALVSDLTNPDMFDGDELRLPRDAVHILRSKTLVPAACVECLKLQNFSTSPVEIRLSLYLAADFADIFEVRGMCREKRGQLLAPVPTSNGLVLPYIGVDEMVRRTRVVCDPMPIIRPDGAMIWPLRLDAGQSVMIEISIHCETGRDSAPRGLTYTQALGEHQAWIASRRKAAAHVHTSNQGLNDWLNYSRSDLDMLLTPTPDGPITYAGIPWFSTIFGRDALITAWQTLWLSPVLARGTLAYLAATQAKDIDPARDAEPGKILHETRKGEMARLGEVPFARYYGTADATPLFVVLAAAYYHRTGDSDFIRRIWPNIRAALDWMKEYGDTDGDSFIEYARNSATGLVNQGWKDSSDSVFHADGKLAEGPIALCEVQAYAYAAWSEAAVLARSIGESEDAAAEWGREAARLHERFDAAFWCEEIGTYALALDGQKRPCRVRASNAGHALFGGIAKPERALRVMTTLMDERSFSGWGVRTVAEGEALYNPMSYHNGSVWPHDQSLIAAGFARYGFHEQAAALMTGMFDASSFLERRRLPELFCGFVRRRAEGPTDYPVACMPQAWASGAASALLGACLSISFDGAAKRVLLSHPVLPPWIDKIQIENLQFVGGHLVLLFRRHQRDVSVNVLEKKGDIEVMLVN